MAKPPIAQLSTADSEWLGPMSPVIKTISPPISPQHDLLPVREWINSEYHVGPLKSALYDYWKQELIDLFERRQQLFEIVVTGGVRCGKTFFGAAIWMRMLYEISCFDNPQRVFDLAQSSYIYLVYLSVTVEKAKTSGFAELKNMVDQTGYFREVFPRDRRTDSRLLFPKNIVIVPGSDDNTALSNAVISATMDEGNFIKRGGSGHVGDLAKALSIYDKLRNRLIAQFVATRDRFPYLLILISSNTNQSSFTENVIKSKATGTKVVTGTVWDTKPPGTFKKPPFYFFCGDEMNNPQVLENLGHWRTLFKIDAYESEGPADWLPRVKAEQREQIITPPGEFLEIFRSSPLSALSDIAGRSSVPTGRFFTSKTHYAACLVDPTVSHPFYKDELVVSMLDNQQIIDAVDKEKIFDLYAHTDKNGKVTMRYRPKFCPRAPRFIHADQSTSGNSTGLACCYVDGVVTTPIGILPVIKFDFILRVNPPPPPDKIALDKVKQLVLDLREHGMVLQVSDNPGIGGMVSFDQYQSEATIQALTSAGIPVMRRSLDAKDDVWIRFSDFLYNAAIRLYDYPPLRRELFGLVHDRKVHKVVKPDVNEDGSEGTDDVIQAVVGASSNAIDSFKDVLAQQTQAEVMSQLLKPKPKVDDPDEWLRSGLVPTGVVAVRQGRRNLALAKMIAAQQAQGK